jgi:hypothetical protein
MRLPCAHSSASMRPTSLIASEPAKATKETQARSPLNQANCLIENILNTGYSARLRHSAGSLSGHGSAWLLHISPLKEPV